MRKKIAQIISFIVSLIVLAQLWFYLFMYVGIAPKPIKIIRLFILGDGEFGYDLILMDMYFSIMILSIAFFIVKSLIYKSKKEDVTAMENN